ncbi:MAG TPA: hypothetical protein VMW12_06380 [Candidatus Dormibacteraeota bacterium]|nr:hypothetical protein [Candidatus Dormibacteraeota bacterium]
MNPRFSAAALLCAALSLMWAAPSRAATAAPAAKPSAAASPSPKPSPTPTPGPPFSNMNWREIGPAAAGGRVAAVAGSATDPKLYYVGSAGGGVWKSDNSGQTWTAVFAKQKVAAIGAVAIDPTDNNTVWVGTGEDDPRNDVSYGDGVYKSTDGGKTWTDMGLKQTKYISRILVDPRDHNHVIVGAQGDIFADSTHRGVYVTNDGGKTWKQTLYVGPMSGVSDMAMDAQNPSILYAGVWQFRRQPWTFTSGGPDDGLYKSTDGGNSWTKLTGHGLPTGFTGRIGLAVAPSNGNRVYALIESSQGILWRSDNGGDTWTMESKNTLIDQRPFYFTHIAVDPKNADKVYAVSEALSMSTDGGKTFKAIADQVHVDYHAIWIAPNDPSRLIVGEDGGYALTLDGGDNWFFSANLPIGQVYRVGLSNENPYWVCAGLQDNNAWCAPNNTQDPSGIQNKAWIASAGGDGEWTIPDPIDPNYLWGDSENGSLTVENKVTKDSWFIEPYLQNVKEQFDNRTARYRWNWESPIGFAPWDGHIAWFGGNVVFQTTDRGMHWKVISPDLTRNIKAHQKPSGGPITNDVSGAEESDTILDIEGSTLHKGEIWVGTDDGLVQLTLDGGKHWSNVTPPGGPEFGRYATVAPSTLVDGTAYAVEDGHYTGDNAPYAFVTHDFGKHWTSIVSGLPKSEWARSIRPDIRNKNLVYLGTEEGIWISYNGGTTWQPFKNNLPTVSVHDIRMQPQFDDLVIATHGRSVYIMDDMAPIQQLQEAIAHGSWLFQPRTSYEYNQRGDDEGTYTNYAAANPPTGVMITYYQNAVQKTAPKLEILDDHGRVIRTVQGTHKVGDKEMPYVPNKVGLNRYVWDFSIDGPIKWMGAAKKSYEGPDSGPPVPPGSYSVSMTLGGKNYVKYFQVKADPRTKYTQKQIVDSFVLAKEFEGKFSSVDTMLNNIDSITKALNAASAAAKKANDTALASKLDAALASRDTVFNFLTADYHNDEDSIERPGALREDLQFGQYLAGTALTPAILDSARRVNVEYQSGVAQYNAFVTNALPGVDAALKAANQKPLPAISTVHAQ